MIPLLGGALGLIATTVNAVGLGATAGAGYGLGRKWGRHICEWSDTLEIRFTSSFVEKKE